MTMLELPAVSADGHRSCLRLHPAGEGAPGLVWLPALGVPAQKYDGFARALAAAGVSCAVHEWRGIGSSSLRARRGVDWGYREILQQDLPASRAALDPNQRWHYGGHSLGGQFAAMAAARQPLACAGLVLLATGVPDETTFRGRQRLGIGMFARLMPLLTAVAGHYPGEALRFAGREASQLMRDWAATVRSGRYLGYGDAEPLDEAMARLHLPVLALRMANDWLAPRASLQALLDKLGGGHQDVEEFDDGRLGAPADHFRWMRQPDAVAACIAAWMRASS